MVVRKPYRPSFCPNPDAGTTHIPVACSNDKQYNESGDIPISVACAMAFNGMYIDGKAYIAPADG